MVARIALVMFQNLFLRNLHRPDEKWINLVLKSFNIPAIDRQLGTGSVTINSVAIVFVKLLNAVTHNLQRIEPADTTKDSRPESG